MYKDWDWIQLAYYMSDSALLWPVISLRFPQKAENFSTGYETLEFLRRTLLCVTRGFTDLCYVICSLADRLLANTTLFYSRLVYNIHFIKYIVEFEFLLKNWRHDNDCVFIACETHFRFLESLVICWRKVSESKKNLLK